MAHGPCRHPIEIGYLWPPKVEARFYDGIGLWSDGRWHCNLVLANVKGVKEPRAVITDESPFLKTLWQCAPRFRVEELFLDSKSGVFALESSGIRSAQAIERLYLDPEPCFASKKAEAQFYDRIWFFRIQSLRYQLPPWEAA